MKKIILITVLFLGFLSFGQCKIKTEYDKFEKVTKFTSDIVNIYKGSNGFQTLMVKVSKENESVYSLFIISSSKGCLTGESSMRFLTDKGDIIEIKYTGEINCGTSIPGFVTDENTLKQILESKIIAIRINYQEFYSEVELNEKLQIRLKSLLGCVLDAKPVSEKQ
jgi:hypothetical protein